MRPSSRGALPGGVALLALACASCGAPVIYDTDLRPVRDARIVAALDQGWLAVDSTEAGARAVLELHIEAPAAVSQYVQLHVPSLRCSSSGTHLPARIRRELPVCPAPSVGRAACDPDDRRAGRCGTRVDGAAEAVCLHVVRAEFFFPRMPHLDEESHYFTFGQRADPIRWTRR